jgi:hypothetical protein
LDHQATWGYCIFFLSEGAYTQRGRAYIRRLRPDWAARPPLMSRPPGRRRRKQGRGPHRSRRQPTPLPGLRCGARLLHFGDIIRGKSKSASCFCGRPHAGERLFRAAGPFGAADANPSPTKCMYRTTERQLVREAPAACPPSQPAPPRAAPRICANNTQYRS